MISINIDQNEWLKNITVSLTVISLGTVNLDSFRFDRKVVGISGDATALKFQLLEIISTMTTMDDSKTNSIVERFIVNSEPRFIPIQQESSEH